MRIEAVITEFTRTQEDIEREKNTKIKQRRELMKSYLEKNPLSAKICNLCGGYLREKEITCPIVLYDKVGCEMGDISISTDYSVSKRAITNLGATN